MPLFPIYVGYSGFVFPDPFSHFLPSYRPADCRWASQHGRHKQLSRGQKREGAGYVVSILPKLWQCLFSGATFSHNMAAAGSSPSAPLSLGSSSTIPPLTTSGLVVVTALALCQCMGASTSCVRSPNPALPLPKWSLGKACSFKSSESSEFSFLLGSWLIHYFCNLALLAWRANS